MAEINKISVEQDKDNSDFLFAKGGIKYPQLFPFKKEVDGNDTGDSLYCNIVRSPLRKEQSTEAQPTNQAADAVIGSTPGQVGVISPVDILASRQLKDISPHHASCIQSKKYCTVGLGFVSEGDDAQKVRDDKDTPVTDVQQQMSSLLTGEAYVETKVDKLLDPLTMFGFAHDLYRVMEDFLDGGTGYLEVVRDDNNKIVGLNWLPYENIDVIIMKDTNGKNRLVYRYLGGVFNSSESYYSTFGVKNKEWVKNTFYPDAAGGKTLSQISEVIPFMLPSNQSTYYGYPDWLSASTIVTLLSRALQYKSDFYVNRGVLAYILSISGSIDGEKWKEIQRLVQGSVGAGNNFRNLAINLPNAEGKVQVDKLASSEKTEDQFSKDSEVFAQHIVSAHRVPPILANILIAGKLGAANETVQALICFQLLQIGPMQQIIQKTLAKTLGSEKGEGVAGLKPEDFRLRKITSQFNIQGLDTTARMRSEAAGSGRNVSAGLKK